MTSDEQKLKDILEVIKSLECKPSDDRLMGVLYDDLKGEITFEYHSGNEIKVDLPQYRNPKRKFRSIIMKYINKLF